MHTTRTQHINMFIFVHSTRPKKNFNACVIECVCVPYGSYFPKFTIYAFFLTYPTYTK